MKWIILRIIGAALIITIIFLDSLEGYYPFHIWGKTICEISISIAIGFIYGLTFFKILEDE